MMRAVERAAVMMALVIALPGALTAGAAVAADAEPPTEEELHPPGELATEVAAEPAVGERVEPSPLVDRLLDDALTTGDEQRRLRIFHGRWEQLDEAALTVDERARLALLRFELDADALADDAAEAMVRAEAALWRGEPERTLALLGEDASIAARLLRARAHEAMGQLGEAVDELDPLRHAQRPPQGSALPPAEAWTALAEAITMLARLEGRPAEDYQRALNLLAAARDRHDPLYWPAYVAEGRLLLEKDNTGEGIEALLEALALNPQAGEAWYLLGRRAALSFDFDRSEEAIEQLRLINDDHLLAQAVEAHMRLVQRDPEGAAAAVAPALERYPAQRELLALDVAAAALSHDEAALAAALERFERVAPRNPLAHFLAGRYLSLARQYELAEAMLREALARQPNDPAARVELGLLLMQAGRDDDARVELARAARLDPFDRRAANQLHLVEQLLSVHQRIETEHFIITYKPGIDTVLARDVAREVEAIHDELTAAFEHEPVRKTQIDLMPDAQWFGVRITGLPEIWTVAAATGPVIAFAPPREGSQQRGTFDWHNVMRHEYVHTINLSQTRNRVAHWLTEAAGIAYERRQRDYATHRLLAWALHEDELFDLDNIIWGFVRPRTPRDRPLAYAQSHWMYEFIVEQFGRDAVLELLDAQAEGMGDVRSLEAVTGVSAATFTEAFLDWAHEQVEAWGLAPQPPNEAQRAIIGGERELTVDALSELIEEAGAHPEALRVVARFAVEQAEPARARELVRRYADARPVDPWPHEAMLELALDAGQEQELIAALQHLDDRQLEHGRWALQLARRHRAAGRLDEAGEAIKRALYREPYNADYRELAGAIALQRRDMDEALHHLEAMPLLEPDRAQHHVRLAALYSRLGRAEDAAAAARRAQQLDPAARVGRFLE
ncbi:MAG: tetratricopeptide repeat protein [Phycisphaeraceae bacterium]